MSFGGGGGSAASNLRSFLDCTTPIIPAKFLQKTCISTGLNRYEEWNTDTDTYTKYFTLKDLWRCYDEWSAYGAGVPIVTNGGDRLVQYYVPYLSAIQIFTAHKKGNNFDEDDTRISVPLNERLGHLDFQYFERSTPYERVPLMDKIVNLARGFPDLLTLTSIEVSPGSWMAVAWYPIYHIPAKRSVRGLSTSFLTYHTLSSIFQGGTMDEEEKEDEDSVRLPAFGLATYKLGGNINREHNMNMNDDELWRSGNEGNDGAHMQSLLMAADSWLIQLGVRHHDFEFFTRHRKSWLLRI